VSIGAPSGGGPTIGWAGGVVGGASPLQRPCASCLLPEERREPLHPLAGFPKGCAGHEACFADRCGAKCPPGADILLRRIQAVLRHFCWVADGGGQQAARQRQVLRFHGGMAKQYAMVGCVVQGGANAEFLLLRRSDGDDPGSLGRLCFLNDPGYARDTEVPHIVSEDTLARRLTLAEPDAAAWGVAVVETSLLDLRTMVVVAEQEVDFPKLEAADAAMRALAAVQGRSRKRARVKEPDLDFGAPKRRRRRRRGSAGGDEATSEASELFGRGEADDGDDDGELDSSSGSSSDNPLQGRPPSEPLARDAAGSARPLEQQLPGEPSGMARDVAGRPGRGWGRQRGVDRYPAVPVRGDAGEPLGRILINSHASAQSLDAHCSRCTARVNRTFRPRAAGRSAQGRPLGALLAWLQVPCIGGAVEHRALWSSEALPFARRVAARASVQDDPDFASLRDMERPPWPGEGLEPELLV
jgi:hypothetical protein